MLQQAASARLKLGVAETMEVAQKLYETGRITYMRTGSTALSAEAVEALRGVTAAKWGKEALPPSPVAHASAAQAQEAHEAIRPADAARCVAGESDVAERVYDLVRRRALASHMSDGVLRRTRVGAESAGVGLRAQGTVVVRSGWYAAWPPGLSPRRWSARVPTEVFVSHSHKDQAFRRLAGGCPAPPIAFRSGTATRTSEAPSSGTTRSAARSSVATGSSSFSPPTPWIPDG